MKDYLNLEGLTYFLGKLLNKFVKAEDGKGLSTNDYTTSEKNKLAGIAEGANKTIVDSSLSSTSTNPVQNKVVNNVLESAKAYADDIKNDLLNGAGGAYDTLKELGDLIDDNTDAIDALEAVAAGKANAVHEHPAYVNQNAFSNVTVGSTTIASDSATDTLTLVAGNNVTLTPDSTNDKITIAATDTVYTHPSYTARTGAPTENATPGFGETFNVSQPVSDSTGHITAINSRTVTIPNATATTSSAGLMSSDDKSKLDSINTTDPTFNTVTANKIVGAVYA